jgi:hypothetical protein
MKLKVNRDKHIQHTVSIWSGYYSLTNLEQKILAYIIKHYVELNEKIKDKELIQKNFLDSEFKKELMKEFSIKPPQLTTYLKSLINKKVLKEEQGYTLDIKFIPTNKLVFEFIYEN